MPSTVFMPKTGADATEAKLLRWLKKDGDQITRGDVLAEIETDKVNMEVEAFDAGVLHITAPEGSTHAVGATIGLLLKAGEQPPSASSAGKTTAQAASTSSNHSAAATSGAVSTASSRPLVVSAQTSVQTAPNGHQADRRLKASPLARRLAHEHNLDLALIHGRGPGGRVVKDDVEAAIAAALVAPQAPAVSPVAAPTISVTAQPPSDQTSFVTPAAGGASEKALTRIQVTTARRLSESKQTAPHFYLTIEVDMAEAMRLRATLNEQAEGSVKISVNDLVIKAIAWALQRHPSLNASFRATPEGGVLVLHDRINVSVAIALEEGLVSPVIPDADRKSLGQIARESRALIERARAGKLRPDDYAEGTITISNLGMFDIDTFVAIINPPQAAIIAVGAVRQAPVVRDGALTIGEIMKVTISADHRATDGAQAARFLNDLRRALEKPLLMAL